ncbi:MAG: serpin family protein [Acutalibacter muris]|nr:serpin family protein [Acutalibacter muris]
MKLTSSQKLTLALIILAVLLAVTAAVVAFSGGTTGGTKPLFAGSGKLAGPKLPQLSFENYPTEEQERELSDITSRVEAFREELPRHAEALAPFFERSTRQILSSHGGENQIYSPLNLYMALSMAAEVTGGSTQGQILDLLGAPDLESLRDQSQGLWLMSSLNLYGGETDLANSIWLNNSIDYKQETLDILAKDHFADSFWGQPGTEEYNKLLQDWTNEKTRNLLEDSANSLQMDPSTLLTLMSTVYFKASWHDMFPEDLTAAGTFHAPQGDIEHDFMHQGFSGGYCRGEHFGAASLSFRGGAGMTLLLPDEDSGVDALLAEGSDLWDFLSWQVLRRADPNTPEWEESTWAKIKLALPKFDVSSNSELTESLIALGMTDAFDPDISDFSPLMDGDIPVCISKVNHAARVMVDEEGCTAASYVEIMVAAGAAMGPDEIIDFTLDRPFIFVIHTTDGMPLFAGVVNRP